MLYPKYDKNIYDQYTKEAKPWYIYYIYIPRLCLCSVLMLSILIIFGYITFFGYRFGQMRVNTDIFITFRLHQVKLRKVPLNRNKKRGGVVPVCPEVKIFVIG